MIGAILTGGAGRRFEGVADKALAPVSGRSTLGGGVRDALRGVGLDPVVAVGGTAGASLGLITIPDRRPGEGPLAATASVLLWAGRGHVLVVPCDLPLIQPATLRPIVDAAVGVDDDTAVVALIDGRPEHSIAVWPASRGRAMWRRVEAGERALRVALDLGPWLGVELDGRRLCDADTASQLARLLEGP